MYVGESSRFEGVMWRTECGVPSVVTKFGVAREGTTLRFSWNAPREYNGDISEEQYLVCTVVVLVIVTRFLIVLS